MNEEHIIDIASQMLNCYPEALDREFPKTYANLMDVDTLCQKAGGYLVSRQVIALIVLSSGEYKSE